MWQNICLIMLCFHSCILPAFSSESSEIIKSVDKSNLSVSVSIPYRTASHYFIKNTVKNTVPVRISNRQDFEQYFGMAATMDISGKPTNIDFTQEEVLIYDAGINNQQIDIFPIDLRQSDQELHLNIEIKKGASLGYQIHPFMMLIIPKNNADKVLVHVQQY